MHGLDLDPEQGYGVKDAGDEGHGGEGQGRWVGTLDVEEVKHREWSLPCCILVTFCDFIFV